MLHLLEDGRMVTTRLIREDNRVGEWSRGVEVICDINWTTRFKQRETWDYRLGLQLLSSCRCTRLFKSTYPSKSNCICSAQAGQDSGLGSIRFSRYI